MKSIKMSAEKNVDIPLWNEGTKHVYIIMGILFAYVAVLEFLGFIIAATVMEALFIQWFAKKKPWITVIIALVVTLVIYCVFRYVLNVPVGSFGILVATTGVDSVTSYIRLCPPSSSHCASSAPLL